MHAVTRRHVLQALAAAAAGGAGLCAAGSAHATVMRALDLPALAQRSTHIVLGRALDASSRYVSLPGSRRIVTDISLRVDDVLAAEPPHESLLIVRVLGGVVGRNGEYVAGQAELTLGAPCALFLRQLSGSAEPYWVTGLAQGHFPVVSDDSGTARLTPSPRLPTLVNPERSAARALGGLSIPAAREAIQRALRP